MLRVGWIAVGVACLVLSCEKKEEKPATAPEQPAPPAASRPLPLDAAIQMKSGPPPGKTRDEMELILPGIGQGPARVQTAEEAELFGDPQCPRFIGARTTSARKIGIRGRAVAIQEGWFWQVKDGVMNFFDGKDGERFRTLPADKVPKGVIAVEGNYWYVKHCEAAGCGPHGTGVVVDRIGPGPMHVTELVGPQSEIIRGQVWGEHLYWITFGPYGNTGELRRIPTNGGTAETLWESRGMQVMKIDEHDVFAADDSTVVAVSVKTGKRRVLAENLTDVRDLAFDADHVYIAESGDPFHASDPSGYIKRVARKGGSVTTLAGPLKWPNVIAVDDERIFYMLRRPGDVWAITKPDGQPTMLVPNPPRDSSCMSSQWLRADPTGIKWVRMVEGFHSGQLWSLQRKFLPSPPGTATEAFVRWHDAYYDGGAPAADGADDDDP